MAKAVDPIPAGYHTVTPYLAIKGATEAIEFYKKAFGADEVMRMPGPDRTIGHAEIKIGDSLIMLADERPDMNFLGPKTLKGSTIHIHLYVKDSDAVFNQAVAAGAKGVRPIEDQFYGDRTGSVEDPFGHIWHIATHKEDVPPEELKKRAAALAASAEKE